MYASVQALSDGKCVASAHWLNDVLTEQKMFPPSNPLHFPTAFQWQLPGAEKYVSATSEKEGEGGGRERGRGGGE